MRAKSPQGPVDFLTAHFASSSNNPACTETLCPPICPVGIETNECHGIQVADFLTHRTGAALTVVGGDLNATPDEPAVAHLRDAGFVDGWLAAGKPECDTAHRAGCTAGGTAPDPWVGMDTRAGARFDERIDYVWVKPGRGCTVRVRGQGLRDHTAGGTAQRDVVAVRSRRSARGPPVCTMSNHVERQGASYAPAL